MGVRTEYWGKRMSEYKHRGYIIRAAVYYTPLGTQNRGWDIADGDKVRKRNFASIDLCRRYIDAMIKCGQWEGK